MSSTRPYRAENPGLAVPSGAAPQARARSCAAVKRRTNRGSSATVASGISSERIATTRYPAVSFTSETCTTARLSAKFLGCTKCTPFTT